MQALGASVWLSDRPSAGVPQFSSFSWRWLLEPTGLTFGRQGLADLPRKETRSQWKGEFRESTVALAATASDTLRPRATISG
jgi:hypothetical protein